MSNDRKMDKSSSSSNNGAGGRLWSNLLLDEEIDSIGDNISKTNLDKRKTRGLEERGTEQYLTQVVTNKAKKFVNPRILKTGRGRGGFRSAARAHARGRGHGAGILPHNLQDFVRNFEENAMETEQTEQKQEEQHPEKKNKSGRPIAPFPDPILLPAQDVVVAAAAAGQRVRAVVDYGDLDL